MSLERRYALLKHTHEFSTLSGGLITIGSGSPTVRWNESDASTDNAIWDWNADGEDFKMRLQKSDLSAATDVIVFNRTDITSDAIQLRANVIAFYDSAGNKEMFITGATQTGSQTATFAATNKPGAGAAGPIAWLKVETAANATGWIPVFGN